MSTTLAKALSWLGQAASDAVEANVAPSTAKPPLPAQPPPSSVALSSQSGVLNSPELDEWHQIARGTCSRALEGGRARGDPLPSLESLPLIGTRNVRGEELQKVFFLWTNGATARPCVKKRATFSRLTEAEPWPVPQCLSGRPPPW